MLERGANSWFYSCETKAQREKEKRNRWLSEILTRYKEQMLKDFHLGRVLPYLVYDGVFSLKEYREILSQDCYPERVDRFLLRLFSKGPGAFCAFCSHLEEFSPYLLTLLFLYYQEQTQRILQDMLVAEEAARIGTHQDPNNVSVTEDQEQRPQLFHRMLQLERLLTLLQIGTSLTSPGHKVEPTEEREEPEAPSVVSSGRCRSPGKLAVRNYRNPEGSTGQDGCRHELKATMVVRTRPTEDQIHLLECTVYQSQQCSGITEVGASYG
ncbi:hypothetical protein STEG23_016525 [Scotinomys teguina]